MQRVVNEEKLTIKPDQRSPWLKGLFRPQSKEWDADSDSLEVIGEIPKDLWGVYARNTHNQVHEPIGTYHPFDGDGMIHAAYFKDGRMEYRNRFVHTTGFLAEKAAGRALWPGVLDPQISAFRGWGAIGAMKDNAGTDVIGHAGSLLITMSQGSEPWRMDPITLENLGPDPKLAQTVKNDGIAGEFKTDLKTGEMFFQNYPENPPCIRVGTVDPKGNLTRYVQIDLPSPRWPHDLGVTENYIVVHDLPYHFDPELLKQGIRRHKFFEDQPSRFGIFPRNGDVSAEDVQWFETKPCWILHTANYYEEGDEIIMDGCISFTPHRTPVSESEDSGPEAMDKKILAALNKHETKTRMYQWRFNLKTGKASEGFIDEEEITEFPVVNNYIKGYPYRYAYCSTFAPGAWLMDGIKKYDMQTGETDKFIYGKNRYGGEMHFAARQGATSEDDGYLVVFIQDGDLDRSECAIFDAQKLSEGPICQIILPERIQSGTHACWLEGERLAGEPCA